MSKSDAAELVNRVQIEITPGLWENVEPSRSCVVCGSYNWSKESVLATATVERYAVPCGGRGCERPIEFEYTELTYDGWLPFSVSTADSPECVDCGWPGGVEDLRIQFDPTETAEYLVPVEAVVSRDIHGHHISYDPEDIVDVCNRCHQRIHKEDGFNDDLKPDQKRPAELR